MLAEAKDMIKNGVDCLKIEDVRNFDVRKIFDCGQCFRFEPVENSEHEAEFSGVAFGKFISVAQDGSDVYLYNVSREEYERVWKSYLSLDVDYASIDAQILSLTDNEQLRLAVEYGKGIRILAQEPWEAVCSFIVSQNNNIPRIKKIIEAMARECGEAVEGRMGNIEAHKLEYVDNTDGTHCYGCDTCDYVEIEKQTHTFIDGICVCGAVGCRRDCVA